jgi:methionine synthase / methylenetetrahydrofolate reductase(NADPH)
MKTPDPKLSLLERLKKSVVVADGAMGTMVSQLSPHPVDCIESLTLTNPELIADIHRQYVRAGAQILETNTFAANRVALSRFRLEEKTVEINRRAVAIARAEAGTQCYVAASIGPLRTGSGGDVTETGAAGLTDALKEQLQTLLGEGVDLLVFETFSDADDLLDAVQTAKKLTDVPVLASMTAGRFGTTGSGEGLASAAQKLVDAGADIIGLNCGYGIRAIEGAMEYLSGLGVPLSVMPNAGFPEQVGGRLRYGASEEYLANEAVVLAQMGARVIGGCCGTTPAHIEAIVRKLREKRIVIKPRMRHDIETVPADEPFKPGALLARFSSVKLPVICEIDPPSTLSLERNAGAILACVAAGADAVSMGDNPLATIKVENLAFAAHVKKLAKVPVITHLTGRDRNLLGIQSFMLGAHVLGIESLLCITGDPSTLHGGPSNVFDANSLGLIKMAVNLNRGKNLLGKEVGVKTDFSIGAAVNPNMADFSPQLRHLRNKVAAGARFAMTQPLYEPDKVREFASTAKDLGIKIFIGVMPVLSSRTAEYLHHEVPGISIPEELRQALGKKDDPHYQMETGLDHARGLIDEIANEIDGLYLIAPHTKPEILAGLVKFTKDKR